MFGFTFDFSFTFYEQKIIVCWNPKVTVSISLSCSTGLEDDGYIQMQTGFSLGEKEIESSFDYVFKYLDDAFNLTYNGFKYRFGNLSINGKTYFKFSINALEIIFVLSESLDYFSCEGTISITIEPGKNIPIPEQALEEEKASNENIKKKIKDALEKYKIPDPLVAIIEVIGIAIIIYLIIRYFPFSLPLLQTLATS